MSQETSKYVATTLGVFYAEGVALDNNNYNH